jgi:hypothetical protein
MTAALVFAYLTLAAPAFAQHVGHVAALQAPGASKVAEASAVQRDLWVGHIFWVRNVVVETFAGNKKAAAAAEKEVVANAKAIAASIEPFYGKAASDQLFTLLAGHWSAIKGYLDAAHGGDKAGMDTSLKQLLANASEIAQFLGGANPNWSVNTLKGLLEAHGAHHVQQIGEFRSRQFDAEAKTWAAMVQHMYVIADALADGIAKQFPDKFR